MTDSLHVDAVGMYCAVGLNCNSATAALRAGLDNFRETAFFDYDGVPLTGAMLDDLPEDGTKRLTRLVRPCISECLGSLADNATFPYAFVLLLDDDVEDAEAVFDACVKDLNVHSESRICPLGRGGIGPALAYAKLLMQAKTVDNVLLAGVSSCFINDKIDRLQSAGRILTSRTNHGFIPGEGSGAVLLSLSRPGQSGLHITGTGYAQEQGCFLQEAIPNKAEAMTIAIQTAMHDCGYPVNETCFHCGDCSGEDFFFREISIALTRCMQQTVPYYSHLVPAASLGETGAAAGPLILAYMTRILPRMDSYGERALLHFSSDSGTCTALICEWIR